MLILALDTTTDLCSVALIRDGQVIDRAVEAGQSHSRLLLPMVDALLAEAGAGLAALDAIAFGAGPGSFTGVRIACAVAQGLAYGADRPVIPVDSLAAMAAAVDAGLTIACLDARMGEVYYAAYRRLPDLPDASGGVSPVRLETIIGAGVFMPGAVPLPPTQHGAGRPTGIAASDWSGCGNGFRVHASALSTRLGPLARIDPSVVPHARQVARLAAVAFTAGEAIVPDLAAPRYVRNKVALDVGEQALLRSGGIAATSAADAAR